MGRFLQALVSEGRARTGGGLFRGVVDSAFAPAVSVPGLPNETRYGFGVFVDRSPWGERVWHPGSVTGFSAYWAAVPASRLAVAVLTNRDGVRLEPIADAAFLEAMGARPSAARSGGKSARAPRAGGSQARRRDGASMASAAADNSSDESPVPRAQARGQCLQSRYRAVKDPADPACGPKASAAKLWPSARQPLHRLMAVARDKMIVHKAGGLHEGIDNRRANKFEAPLLQVF